MSLLTVVAIALSIAQIPAPSAPTVTPPDILPGVTNNQPVDRSEERQVCRREPVIGSNRHRRVCRAASEWAQMRADTRDVMRRNSRGQANDPGAAATGGTAPPGRGF